MIISSLLAYTVSWKLFKGTYLLYYHISSSAHGVALSVKVALLTIFFFMTYDSA